MRTFAPALQTAARQIAAPIPLGGLRRLILGARQHEGNAGFRSKQAVRWNSSMTLTIRLVLLTCLCCGEDVDFAQDYRPNLPFCSYGLSESCRKCRSQVRVRKFQQDPPSISLAGDEDRGSNALGAAAPSLLGAICARTSPNAPSGRQVPIMETAEGVMRK